MKRTLIKNADWIITMDNGNRLKNSDILIEDGVIVKVGKNIGASEQYDEVINAEGKVITPGFINIHDHFFQAMMRSLPQLNFGLSFEEWIKINFEVFRFADGDVLKAGTYASVAGLLKSGCTTSCDHHMIFRRGLKNIIDKEIEAASEMGIRFHSVRANITTPGEFVSEELVENLDDILADCDRLIDKYNDPSRFSMLRTEVGVDICGVNATDEAARRIHELALKRGVRFNAHLSDDREETEMFLEEYGCRPVEYADRLGLIGKETWFAHCADMNEAEMKLFAERGTCVSHSPIANLQTACVAHIPQMLAAGIPVGLGVDGIANSNANIMTEMLAASLAHMMASPGNPLSSEQILEMATMHGAKALGRDDIGMLKEGMAADLVIFDWNKLEYMGAKHDPVECIVLSGNEKLIDTVMVQGKIKVRKGQLTDVDEEKLSADIETVSRELDKKIEKVIGR